MSPASLLEKVMLYEAVHPIQSWPDLHQRLGPMRRSVSIASQLQLVLHKASVHTVHVGLEGHALCLHHA